MSITSLLGTDGRLARRSYAALERRTIREQRATRQERALLDNEEYNEAFRTFVVDRDNEATDDAIALASVL